MWHGHSGIALGAESFMSINISGHFVLRKLHQLTGIFPLGVFLLEHFYTNSKAMGGAEVSGEKLFNDAVRDLQSIPYIIFIEVLGIFIPLIFHGVYGLVITYEAKPNVLAYNYGRNWLYLIQRVTGIIVFVFITFHVLNFRFGLIPGLNTLAVAEHPDMAFGIVRREFLNPVILTVYIIGITSTTFHLANGLWLFLVDWGVAVGRRAQRLIGYVCAAFGVALTIVGINAALAFIR
jgi:succinate dehydrogenase / fumarate reductase cytochrome b subunit